MSFIAPFACIKSPRDPCLIINMFDIIKYAYIYYPIIVKKINMNTKLDKILTEISAGELIDKITILEIKKEKIKNKDKLVEIEKELSSLNTTMKKFIPNNSEISEFKNKLKETNLKLWNIENGTRSSEKNKDFGPKFVELARGVYMYNDERAKIKLTINNSLGSNIKEVKHHE